MSAAEAEAAAALSQQWLALTHVRSEEELMALVGEMRSLVWRYHAKRYLRKFLPLFVLVAILVGLSYNVAVVDTCLTVTRLALVNYVYPFLNFPKLAEITCLVRNPFFEKNAQLATAEECDRCAGVSRPLLAPAENFTAAAFHRDFFESETPVVVQGGARGWLLENMTVQHLHDFYVQEEMLKKTLACKLFSDQRIDHNNNKLLLHVLLDRKPGRWFAMWEHCTLPQAKAFRPLYVRPPFLPPSISIGGDEMHSWLVLGRNPENPEPVPLEYTGGFFFLGQVRGKLRVVLQPNVGCKACAPIDFVLEAGDLLLTTEFYELLVIPTGPAFSLSFGFAGEA